MKTAIPLAATILLAGCATPMTAPAGDPAARWFEALSSMCGRTVEGRIATSTPPGADADFAGRRLVARGGPCSADEIRIAFDVGENRSRTWIVTRTATGVRLKHRHLLDDGQEDPVSRYGGDSRAPGTEVRQEFPVDAETRDVFTRENLPQSLPNVWAMEIRPGDEFVYELARPGRLFRVSFAL